MHPSKALSPGQLRLYYEHGEAMSKYPIKESEFVKDLKITRHAFRTVQVYVDAYGPPSAEDLQAHAPGAIHLVIPDAHAKPGESNERFEWLGKEIEEVGREALELEVPFRVISIGDFGDMPSLSHYDRGKASAWGRTYAADAAAMMDAILKVKDNCSPEIWNYADKFWTEGNHEERCARYMQENPELQGILKDPFFIMSDAGFKPVPYLQWLQLDGVGYSHYMQNAGGRAVSGVNHARSLLLKGYRSVVVGHSHRLDTYTTADAFGNPLKTLVCGCYFEHDEEYAGQSNSTWWRGLCVLRNVRRGGYDLETRTLASIRQKHVGD